MYNIIHSFRLVGLILIMWCGSMYGKHCPPFGGTLQNGWKILNLGDEKGMFIAGKTGLSSVNPAFLCTPNERSWIFLVRNFAASDLEGVERICVNAVVMSNHPVKVMVRIVDGAYWVDNIDRSVWKCPETSMTWEHVSLELDLRSRRNIAGVAVGLDYFSRNSWLAVDSIWVELLGKGEQAAPPPEVPIYVPELPMQIKNSLRLESQRHGLNVEIGEALTPVDMNLKAVSAPKVKLMQLCCAQNGHASATLIVRNETDFVETFRVHVTGAASRQLRVYRLYAFEGGADYPRKLHGDDVLENGLKDSRIGCCCTRQQKAGTGSLHVREPKKSGVSGINMC